MNQFVNIDKDAMAILEVNCLKAARVDLKQDSFHVFANEKEWEKNLFHFTDWVNRLAEQIQEEDKPGFFSALDPEDLMIHFRACDDIICAIYRRQTGDEVRQTRLTVMKSSDYTEDNPIVLVTLIDMMDRNSANWVETLGAGLGEKWINAVMFDINAELERQAKLIRSLQLRRFDPDKVAATLSQLKKGNFTLRNLIKNANNIHDSEERRLVLNETPQNLRTMLGHFEEQATEKAAAQDMNFQCRVSNLKDAAVYCDQEKFMQILNTMLANAIQGSRAGGKIVLKAAQEGSGESGFGSYVIEMRDNGVGMTEREIQQIFDTGMLFGRGVIGSLGLPVVKQLVELMGGEIQIDSEPGFGTECRVRLPLRLMASSEETEPIEMVSGKRILVVDDNLLSCEIVAAQLREVGADVEIAVSGEEAVDMVCNYYEGYYDIVLLDIQMNGIDGYEAARRIREIPWATKDALKIIALSAFDYDEERDRDSNHCFNSYCMKPFDLRRFYVAAFDSQS